jgi:hypothetical protein
MVARPVPTQQHCNPCPAYGSRLRA